MYVAAIILNPQRMGVLSLLCFACTHMQVY